MPRQSVPNEEVINAMDTLFKAIGPFEPALRQRDRNVVLDNQVPDTDRMLAQMVELEKALCCVNWSIIMLKGWRYRDGIEKDMLRVKIKKNRLSLHEEIEYLRNALQPLRRWGLAAKALEETDEDAYIELVLKFKKVFSALKRNSGLNFVYGTTTYLRGVRGLGGLKYAIKGAWKGRSLAWSSVITDDMDFYISDLEIFVEQLNERARNRGVEEYFQGDWISDDDIEVYDHQEDLELGMWDEEMEDVDDDECEETDAGEGV